MSPRTLLLALFSSIAHAQQYTMTELLSPESGSTGTAVYGLNNTGQVVGQAYFGDNSSAILWSAGIGTALQEVNLNSVPMAVNAGGVAAGFGFGSSDAQALTWAQGVATTLNNPNTGFDSDAEALAINDSGQAVGYVNNSATQSNYAVTWIAGGAMPLASNGADVSEAEGINNTGLIVGYGLSNSTGLETAIVWGNGAAVNLNSLGGTQTEALAVNDAGEIVGWSDLSPGDTTTHAVSWTSGLLTDLGTLGGSVSEALSINASGQIVGYSNVGGDPVDALGNVITHAVIWNAGVLVDLNTEIDPAVALYVTLTSASGINDSGQIAVNGIDTREQYPTAYLMTPVVAQLSTPAVAPTPTPAATAVTAAVAAAPAKSGGGGALDWLSLAILLAVAARKFLLLEGYIE